MTKRMIDADLLLQWFSNQTYINFIDDIVVRFVDIKYGDIINKINELAKEAKWQNEF